MNVRLICWPAALASASLLIGCSVPTVWTEPREITHDWPAATVTSLRIKTHNGNITFNGDDEQSHGVKAMVRGGGRNAETAALALDAIETFVEADGKGGHRIGWRWREQKQSSWRGRVDFEVDAPYSLSLVTESHNGKVVLDGIKEGLLAETHNGAITVKNAHGNVSLFSHNGKIDAVAGDGTLHCKTHNGPIDVQYTGTHVNISTHNGPIKARVMDADEVGGFLSSHNGSINLELPKGVSSQLRCSTHNGSIRCNEQMRAVRSTKRTLVGTLGEGGETIALETHNGGISVSLAE